MARHCFSEFSNKAILATASFLQLPVDIVEEYSCEEEDEIGDAIKNEKFNWDTIELGVSEKIFSIYGKKISLVYSFEQSSNEIKTNLILFFGKVKDFFKTDEFLETLDLPDDTHIIYGEGDSNDVDISMEIYITSKSMDLLYQDILNVLNRFSTNENHSKFKELVEQFEDQAM